jgi:hypothetical protein
LIGTEKLAEIRKTGRTPKEKNYDMDLKQAILCLAF